MIFILPLVVKKIEENLEVFLFTMGILAALTTGILNKTFILEVLQNKFIYLITAAVLIGGFLFKVSNRYVKGAIDHILQRVPIKVFIFLLVVICGLISSVLTAIVTALFLVEIINLLPISRKTKIKVDIVACFAIGIGAVLTPIGEPLATIVVSKLHVDFWYMLRQLGPLVIPGIIAFGILGAVITKKEGTSVEETVVIKEESYKDIIVQAFKVFLFVIALEFLGAGFKPVIDAYVIKLNAMALYWLNMSSAILDNATLASAEISARMTAKQITAILMGLLVSGGMMIPGNIPNIISAGKLKIKSKEWISFGVPVGLIAMAVYFVIIFI